jgi:hypothetical protein
MEIIRVSLSIFIILPNFPGGQVFLSLAVLPILYVDHNRFQKEQDEQAEQSLHNSRHDIESLGIQRRAYEIFLV